MKLEIDTDAGTIKTDNGAPRPLLSAEAFSALSDLWVRVGWNQKYSYGFSWFGRPIIQMPEDLIRIQEVIWRLQPDVVFETGIAHGGSLVFYASILKAIGKGRVVGVDIDIRPHNKAAIDQHPLKSLITTIEGSSIDPAIVAKVREHIPANGTVLVLLDSNHTYDHVMAELKAYAPLVSVGSYIVATDGVMEYLAGDPRTQADWGTNNPRRAALAFAKSNPAFALESPTPGFNEAATDVRTTYWPDAYLKRMH